MEDIEIFKEFYNFEKIIKKQKKADKLYRRTFILKSEILSFISLICAFFFISFFSSIFFGLKNESLYGIVFMFLSAFFALFLSFKLDEFLCKLNTKKNDTLLNYYIFKYSTHGKRNFDKFKNKINKFISPKEIDIFFKIKDVKEKAFREYVFKEKGVNKRDIAMKEFNKQDKNYYLTLKYIIKNADIKDLKNLDGLKAKKNIEHLSIDQQLDLSNMINQKVNSENHKEQTIQHNLKIIDQVKVKNVNIINI